MKKKIIILFLITCSFLFAQEFPDWVQTITEGKSFEREVEFYIGVGISQESQDDADQKAKKNFTTALGTKIKTSTEEQFAERKGKVSELTKQSYKSVSENLLFNVRILKRYHDKSSNTFYALIMKKKDEYNKQIQQEVDNYISRKKSELDLVKKENELSWKMQQEKEKKERLRKIQKNKMIAAARRFKKIETNPFLLTFENGQYPSVSKYFSVKAGINNFSLRDIYFLVHGDYLGVSINSQFDKSSRYNLQNAKLNIRLLENRGELYPFGLAVGVVVYKTNLIITNFIDGKNDVSPYAGGNIKINQLMHSEASVYFDKSRLSAALVTYPFFDSIEDIVSTIIETNLYLDDDVSWEEKDFSLNFGINVKSNEKFNFAVSFEEFELFMFRISLGLDG